MTTAIALILLSIAVIAASAYVALFVAFVVIGRADRVRS